MSLYYKDHAIELALWEKGHFRLGVSAALTYFESHPIIRELPSGLNGLEVLNKEYGELSMAVHGSSTNFRMTDDGKAVSLWKMDEKYLSIWATHEKKTIAAVNMLLLALFHEQLEGTKFGSLRESLSLVIPAAKDADIKTTFKVTIKRST